jgi:hypothetical protein
MSEDYMHEGSERRQFLRLEYATPLAYKVCKQETLSQILHGYTVNISESGLLCRIDQKINKDEILWLSFDRATLNTCEELERRCLIYQRGVIGKVVRIEPHEHEGRMVYLVGIQFLTREEKDFSKIYPQLHSLEQLDKS